MVPHSRIIQSSNIDLWNLSELRVNLFCYWIQKKKKKKNFWASVQLPWFYIVSNFDLQCLSVHIEVSYPDILIYHDTFGLVSVQCKFIFENWVSYESDHQLSLVSFSDDSICMWNPWKKIYIIDWFEWFPLSLCILCVRALHEKALE